MKNKVTDRDRGAKRLLKALSTAGTVTVGIHEADGAVPKEGDEEGLDLIDVALIHEFGSVIANIPERSFIRAWADENVDAHNEQARKVARAIVEGELDVEKALLRLGVLRQAEVQKRIAQGIPPPLEQATIDRKGSSKPLIDTGQLRGAVSHKVEVSK